jgi:DNA-binding transcriptional ArsR family regulator
LSKTTPRSSLKSKTHEEKLAFVASNPTRVRIRSLLNEGPRTIKEITAALTDVPEPHVRWHIGELLKVDSIELVGTKRNPPNDEHIYRAVGKLDISDEEFEAMPRDSRHGVVRSNLEGAIAETAAAYGAGHFTDDKKSLSWWDSRDVDSQGLDRLVDLRNKYIEDTIKVEQESQIRVAQSGEPLERYGIVLFNFKRARRTQQGGLLD